MSSTFISPAFGGSSFGDCHLISPYLLIIFLARHKQEHIIRGGNNPSL
ncbi:MAG: hypothetical protein QM209_04975 [Candidatus Cloacimonadota bacterium]|jgi:hypothetical protein|nr:hypothetical protein [Candidatus Cloacimonas sp.]MDD3605709.1 hypothetical protein [Candidatus Cloacimonas acidaminovorans]MDI9572517.1 hypothetical protein [Candidatus Cloacimonadota bacterium]MDD5407558.1 hypothetical protein [Candidatus Cloacimonas acidaminovorans]NLM90975.1 hypothetical protein [Candidatus Cloacimonadota bacterium]